MNSFSRLGLHGADPPYFALPTGVHLALPRLFGLQLTRMMVLEVVAATAMLMIFIPLARRIRTGGPPRGLFWNAFEAVCMFLRDKVARPAIGLHDGDRFLPLIWTVFFFVLLCNLLGILPWAGSPTGSLSVTGALAAWTLLTVIWTGTQKHGVIGYWRSLVPPMELPGPLAVFLVPLILAIEVLSLIIRHVMLAIRLMANMFAGHLAIAMVLGFIAIAAQGFLFMWAGVAVVSVLMAAALSLLEILIAIVQAYIFTYLSALFIGMSLRAH